MTDPQPPPSARDWNLLAGKLHGELHTESDWRRIYSTDASEYEEMPAAIAIPKSEEDLRQLLAFSRRYRLGLIPRAAGTSLAGQVVGGGIVLDLGHHFARILSIDPDASSVRVEPGVVRDDLNRALASHGLFFAPETSTSNRAMIGGMVGNNSSGANSLIYGTTREHLLRLRGLLSDGSVVTFEPLDATGFQAKCHGPDTLETRIYHGLDKLLRSPENQKLIQSNFPRPSIHRRNTGYALDLLLDSCVYKKDTEKPFNLCHLVSGSEGTLFLGLEYELACVPIPPPASVACFHFHTLQEALRANLVALRYEPAASELLDRHILDCAGQHPSFQACGSFLQGLPQALLLVEVRHPSHAHRVDVLQKLIEDLRKENLGYSHPILHESEIILLWEVRKAGQALMTLGQGNLRPVELVEDTAVDPRDLPAYMAGFEEIVCRRHQTQCVIYGHAGAGVLHARPILDLSTPEGREKFRAIGSDIVPLVKQYGGSLSGEHGDGRLRGEFLPEFFGSECFDLLRQVKDLFDPRHILNPGKIIDAPKMDLHLRPHPTKILASDTWFSFRETDGIQSAAAACNGAGVCRKTHLAGGTMCPSYMATRKEIDSTRARANLLRQLLVTSPDTRSAFRSGEAMEALSLCLSCKACQSECPTRVDVSKLKAEYLQQYFDQHGTPWQVHWRSRVPALLHFASRFPKLTAFFSKNSVCRGSLLFAADLHPNRSLPLPSSPTLRQWFRQRTPPAPTKNSRTILFHCDEFINYLDAPAGIAAIQVLEHLGYRVLLPELAESGRAALSQGNLRLARQRAARNTSLLHPMVSADQPLVGIEPSALLSFRDEYPELLRGREYHQARANAQHCYLLEEFLAKELQEGRIAVDQPSGSGWVIHLHGHCHQKALSSLDCTVQILTQFTEATVRVIPAGCCGMAGMFGYDRDHYEVSQKIGELVLFPYIHTVPPHEFLSATGISCRQQILDGTGRTALHPVAFLDKSLRKPVRTTSAL